MMRQKYDNFNLFPVRCWNFQASDALVSDTLDKVMKLDYRKYNPDGGVGTSNDIHANPEFRGCLLYTSPSPRDVRSSRMPSSA